MLQQKGSTVESPGCGFSIDWLCTFTGSDVMKPLDLTAGSFTIGTKLQVTSLVQ